MQKRRGNGLADRLRAAIENHPGSINDLSRLTGVSQPAISRFLAGADMRLSRAEKLAKYLGLILVERR